MPTIGIYITMPVARALANNWETDLKGAAFLDMVRNLVDQNLREAAGLPTTRIDFNDQCEGAAAHQPDIRCRFCGGVE